MLCGNCRALLLGNARFCYNCGSDLNDIVPAPELNILIAEDNKNMAKLFLTWLEGAGMQCTLESNGDDAWERFKKDRFDLGIFDFDIPIMDGLTLCRKIKEHNPHFPVLICSGHTQIIELQNIEAYGADAIIAKPMKIEHFLYQVQKLTFGEPLSD